MLRLLRKDAVLDFFLARLHCKVLDDALVVEENHQFLLVHVRTGRKNIHQRYKVDRLRCCVRLPVTPQFVAAIGKRNVRGGRQTPRGHRPVNSCLW